MTSITLSLFYPLIFQFLWCHCYNVEFAARIALKYFPTCPIITLTTVGNPSDFQEVSDLDQALKNGYQANVVNSRHLLSTSTITMDGARDLHTHTPYCRVIITFVQGTRFNASDFLNLLTPRENPITLRDVDHYIFLTEGGSVADEKKTAQAILLSDISQEIRYKIVIMSNSASQKKTMVTFCLYCVHTVNNPLGENAVIPVTEDESRDKDITTLFPEFAKNLHGHVLKVVGPSKYISLYEMERIPGSKWYEHKRGMFAEFFFIMQGKLNFTYLLKPCSGFGNLIPEGNTGTLLPNGTWGGCVADIHYRWADLSMGGSPAGDRLHYVEFSTNMRYDYVQFFTHKSQVVYPWTIVFVCFDLYGWACVILSIVVATFVLYKTEDILDTPGPKIGDVLLYLYAYVLGQELCVEPRSVSSKVTFIYWMYYGIVIGATYACSLQSLIVSPGMSMVPETMPELAGASDWVCGVPLSFRNGLAENVFRSSKNKDMRKLYRETQEDKDAVECLRRAATQDYACFHWQIMAEFYMGTIFIDKAGNHPFLYAKDYILFSGPTWMWRKREIWRDSFNDFFGRQFSMGIVYEASARDRRVVRRQLVQDVKDGKRKPFGSYSVDDDGPKAFTFENVKACFVVLMIGLIISALAYIDEIFPKNTARNLKLRFQFWARRVVTCRRRIQIRKEIITKATKNLS